MIQVVGPVGPPVSLSIQYFITDEYIHLCIGSSWRFWIKRKAWKRCEIQIKLI